MKILYKFLVLILACTGFIMGCSSGDDAVALIDDDVTQGDNPNGPNEPNDPNDPNDPAEPLAMYSVHVNLPEGSNVDLANTTMLSLGRDSAVDENGAGSLPFNPGTVEVVYLLDSENNVLLAGFLSDDRKEISMETTAELMLYYGLDYYLLPDQAKAAFMKNVRLTEGFSGFVTTIGKLFVENPSMYAEGTYIQALQALLNQVSPQKAMTGIANRIFFNDEATKSGVTLSRVDSTNIMLQNSLPRRSRALIYKKSFKDRNGDLHEIPNHTDNPIENFELETGKTNSIEELEVGNSISQINAQQASIDNASSTGPILLPVDAATEFVAEYEVVIIGSGVPQDEARNMTETELVLYEDITKKTYVLDYFLPTLLDIGGNKSLLPPFGSDKEEALFNAVFPILEQYPDVVEKVTDNAFKEATHLFLPALYEDIRLSEDLRKILRDVYDVLSGNGDFPNTFIQSQELIETGFARTQAVMRTIDRNIKANNGFANFSGLRTTAFNFESWSVRSIDAVVELQGDNIDLCLGQATEIRVTANTDFEPEVEDVEFHWTTSDRFGGRVQDINGDPNNFGVSIITKTNAVSYISAALESDLGNGDNLETVTVTLFFRNKNTGELVEAGSDSMTVNNLKNCTSFYVPFTAEVGINEEEDSLICGGGTEYTPGHPIFRATFEAVEGVSRYRGRILRKDGTFAKEFTFDDVEQGDDKVEFRLGVGGIYIFSTCNLAKAQEEEQRRIDYLKEVGHQGIEVTPIIN